MNKLQKLNEKLIEKLEKSNKYYKDRNKYLNSEIVKQIIKNNKLENEINEIRISEAPTRTIEINEKLYSEAETDTDHLEFETDIEDNES